jgi:short-subunit dehydrogenase
MNILITGASSGLGLGMAREFAAAGHNLALCARRIEQLAEIREQLLRAHPTIKVFIRALDVTNYEQVFEVFKGFKEDLVVIDRIIVNAGLGKGRPLGTGRFDANLQTAQTNFIGALAQCEAAMEIFRAQEYGHLVNVASIAAIRGQTKAQLTYAATKAGLASMSEGLRLECRGTRIKVTTLFPGFIRTEITAYAEKLPFEVDEVTGSRAMVRAIERGVAEACVPAWPWALIRFVLKRAPDSLLVRMV